MTIDCQVTTAFVMVGCNRMTLDYIILKRSFNGSGMGLSEVIFGHYFLWVDSGSSNTEEVFKIPMR